MAILLKEVGGAPRSFIMAESLPGPSHYYSTDEVLELLEDQGDNDIDLDVVEMNEPVCDGSDDDLELENDR